MANLGPLVKSGIKPHILTEYDFIVETITKNKSIIKIEGPTGEFALKKAKINKNQADRMYDILQFLRKNGISVPEIIPNKFGENLIPVKDGVIYISKWIYGEEVKLNNNQDMLMLIWMLAKIHALGFGYDTKNYDYRYVDELYIRNSWEERVDWLKRYYKGLKKKSPLTTFEHIALTYVPLIIDWAEAAIEELNQWIIENNSVKEMRKTICHGKFHHRNAIINNDEVIILDFEHVSIDTPVRDLAYFIRHYLVNKEHRQWARQWLEVYNEHVVLAGSEKKLLSIYLTFPERLISLLKKYEQKQNNWSEEDYLKKLQLRWGQMKEILWFVDSSIN